MSGKDLEIWLEEDGWSNGRSTYIGLINIGPSEIAKNLNLQFIHEDDDWMLLVSFRDIGKVSFAAESRNKPDWSGVYVDNGIEPGALLLKLKEMLLPVTFEYFPSFDRDK